VPGAWSSHNEPKGSRGAAAEGRFAAPLLLSGPRTRKLPDTLSRLGIVGGAVYDALVALAAQEHKVPLATRDAGTRHL
jgi:toxin FitB